VAAYCSLAQQKQPEFSGRKRHQFDISSIGTCSEARWAIGIGAAASRKAVRWDLRLASLLTHLLSHHTVVWGMLCLLCVILFVFFTGTIGATQHAGN